VNWVTPDWPAHPKVRALSTLRGGGVSLPPYDSLNLGDHVEDAALAVAENRRALRAAAGLPAEPTWLRQVHGTCVMDLDLDGAAEAADAAVTRRPERVCAILTADCLPVLLASATGERVGAVHAGWRGLAAGVIEAAVSALGGSPRDLLAWLGPAIGPRHFEVGAEVREAFLRGAEGGGDSDGGAGGVGAAGAGGGGANGGGSAAGGDGDAAAGGRRVAGGGAAGGRGTVGGEAAVGDSAVLEAAGAGGGAAADEAAGDAAAAVEAAFVRNARGRYWADLYALARLRLKRAGVERVYGGGECTYSEPDRYFSHRRDGRCGRQATLIWLEGSPRR
jgi:copper oxidase (laccase) domain-containing protein